MNVLRRLRNRLNATSHCLRCGRPVNAGAGDWCEDGAIEDVWCDFCVDFVDVWLAPADRLLPRNL